MKTTTDLKVVYTRTCTKMIMDGETSELDSMYPEDIVEDDVYRTPYSHDEYTEVYYKIFDVPSSIRNYKSLKSLTIDAYSFPRGVHIKADLLNGMELTTLKLKGVIVDCRGISSDSILKIPTVEVLHLSNVDGFRRVDLGPVLSGNMPNIRVLKLKTFLIGDQDRALDISECSQLESVHLFYFMRRIPILSENNSKLRHLIVHRVDDPEYAYDMGGTWTDNDRKCFPLHTDDKIHNKDWSFLLDCNLEQLKLINIGDLDRESEYCDTIIMPDWLKELEDRLPNNSVSIMCVVDWDDMEDEDDSDIESESDSDV